MLTGDTVINKPDQTSSCLWGFEVYFGLIFSRGPHFAPPFLPLSIQACIGIGFCLQVLTARFHKIVVRKVKTQKLSDLLKVLW